MSPSGMPAAGMRGQHGDQGADRVVRGRRTGSSGGPARGRRAVLLARSWWRPRGSSRRTARLWGRGRLELRCPQEASGSAQSLLPWRRGAGEGLHVGPVHGQRACWRSCALAGMLASSRSSQTALRAAEGSAVGLVLAQGAGDQAEGALGLPVGELVRAGLPVRGHAEPRWSSSGSAVSAWCTPVRCAGRWSARVEQHARPAGCGRSAAGRAPRWAAAPRSAARRRRRR